ncbi:MAG: glycosyltransferase family 2 protein [Gemmatimonadales bacterium]|nr:glycosyltransferase family 2 protein [Gemmatimonadales bacterium]
MTPRPSLAVVIPAYNESQRIVPTIHGVVGCLRSWNRDFEVLVVDDGSHDETSTLVDRLRSELRELRLIRLAQNQGKGYAVRTGALNCRQELILMCDADLATPIEELARLERAVASGADMAIGSRELDASDVKVETRWYRRLMGRTFHAVVESLAVRGFKDTQCGFKLFKGPVAQDLFTRMRMDRFSFDVELLVMAQRRKYRVDEVPVNWAHQPGSRVNLVTDSLRMLVDLVRIRRNCVRGAYDTPHVSAWPALDRT